MPAAGEYNSDLVADQAFHRPVDAKREKKDPQR